MITLFILSSVIVFYTFLGYPVCLFIWPKNTRKTIVKSKVLDVPVSIIMVAYNEENRVLKKIENLLSSDYPSKLIEIIVASDGSCDKTAALIKELNNPSIKLLDFDERRGKAACLNDAVSAANHDHLIFCDVRQSFDKNAIGALLIQLLSNPETGAVSGELVFSNEGHNNFSKGMDAYWILEKFIRKQESRISSVIGVTGAIYAMKKSSFQPIPSGTILDDVLIPMNVVLNGKKVKFCSDALAVDVPSVDPKHEKKRKMRTLAGNYQLMVLRPSVLNPIKNPAFIQFLSHKVLRLLAPFFLLIAFFSNLFIASSHWLFFITMTGQFLLYGAALLGLFSKKHKQNKLIKIPLAFVSLNWFALLGLKEFLKMEKTHLW